MKPVKAIALDLPTVQRLKAKRAARHYVFRLDQSDFEQIKRWKLPDSCIVVLGLIKAAAFGKRSAEWVTISERVRNLVTIGETRGYRWWLRATSALKAAGLIEVERRRGRLPRYRLIAQDD